MSLKFKSICSSCYSRREPERDPVRVLADELEICCDCGSQTTDGIYARLNPNEVKTPTGRRRINERVRQQSVYTLTGAEFPLTSKSYKKHKG